MSLPNRKQRRAAQKKNQPIANTRVGIATRLVGYRVVDKDGKVKAEAGDIPPGMEADNDS